MIKDKKTLAVLHSRGYRVCIECKRDLAVGDIIRTTKGRNQNATKHRHLACYNKLFAREGYDISGIIFFYLSFVALLAMSLGEKIIKYGFLLFIIGCVIVIFIVVIGVI